MECLSLGYLCLIRHSQPEIVPGVPASEWKLSEEGRQRCKSMAKIVTAYAPDTVVTSQEPKAFETGKIIAEQLQIPVFPVENLHEHERSRIPYQGRNEFAAAVKRFFKHPDLLIFGDETAEEACIRFDSAVGKVLREYTGNSVIVAHGTVISLFAARYSHLEAFSLWSRLGMPSMLSFSLPGMGLVQIVDNVETGPCSPAIEV